MPCEVRDSVCGRCGEPYRVHRSCLAYNARSTHAPDLDTAFKLSYCCVLIHTPGTSITSRANGWPCTGEVLIPGLNAPALAPYSPHDNPTRSAGNAAVRSCTRIGHTTAPTSHCRARQSAARARRLHRPRARTDVARSSFPPATTGGSPPPPRASGISRRLRREVQQRSGSAFSDSEMGVAM